MVNVEQLPPQPFLGELNRMGLQTSIRDENGDRDLFFEDWVPAQQAKGKSAAKR